MIALEHSLDPTSARNFDALMRLVLDTGGITAGIRFGLTTFTFAAATNSAGINQAHGLGRVPKIVVMGGWWVATGTRLGSAHVIEPSSWDASQFPCIATVQGAAYTGTATAAWIALG